MHLGTIDGETRMRDRKSLLCLFILLVGVFFLTIRPWRLISSSSEQHLPLYLAKKQSFLIDIKTVGELEALRSTSISSTIRGDNSKIIYLIADGTTVKEGEILVKLDPTPFEEKVATLKSKIKEQKAFAAALQKGLDWEISQAERDDKTAAFEEKSAELELNKILKGDGPQEIARLKGAMLKALAKFEEYKGYSKDLEELQEKGILSPIEIRQAEKKLEEERETYAAAKLQYDSYFKHVYPMQVKKAETALKQVKMKREETSKVRAHAIGKARVEQEQALQTVTSLILQHNEALQELALTDIRAPACGMVVHREDYRNGVKRKPRVGDLLVRNQIILDLPDLNQMLIKTKVREIDLGKVESGKKATVVIDAYPQLQFSGTITSIGVLALPEMGKPAEEKYFDVRILLDTSDSKLRPGMTARMMIHADEVKDAITIPIHAIFYEAKGAHCYVMSAQGVEKRRVLPGRSNNQWMEIKAGLKEGERLCLSIPTVL